MRGADKNLVIDEGWPPSKQARRLVASGGGTVICESSIPRDELDISDRQAVTQLKKLLHLSDKGIKIKSVISVCVLANIVLFFPLW